MKSKFPGLSYTAFQHPHDKEAIAALAKIPLIDVLVQKYGQFLSDRQGRMFRLSSNLRLGPRQCPKLHDMLRESCDILSVSPEPELFLNSSLEINAFANGVHRHWIVLNAGLVEYLTDDEIRGVVAHEVGHIKCNHMKYNFISYLLNRAGAEVISRLLPLGVGKAVLTGVQLALMHWSRMAEYSCDRAGLLVTQDAELCARIDARLAGFSRRHLPEVDLDEAIRQASEFSETTADNLWDKILSLDLIKDSTHPFGMLRIKEILAWGESEQYKRILSGEYERETPKEAMEAASGPAAGVSCPRCKAVAKAGAKFCPACGYKFLEPATCAKCGATLATDAKFCFVCGAKAEPAPTCEGCGAPLSANSRFCAGCGKAVASKPPAAPDA